MSEKIQELNLPNAVVTRLIKEAVPEGINVAKEARAAIARAASIFVMYLTSTTAVITKKQKHKTLSADNVLEALEEVEFENFIEPLRQELEMFRRANKEKREATKSNGVKPSSAEAESRDEQENTNNNVIEE